MPWSGQGPAGATAPPLTGAMIFGKARLERKMLLKKYVWM